MKNQTFVTKALFRQNLWFLIPYVLLLLMASFFLIQEEKGAMVKVFNEGAHPVFDWFFVFFTHVGDGIFGAVLCLILLFFNRKEALVMAVALILAGVLSQLLKQTLGADASRPSVYFEGVLQFRDIAFLERRGHFSMPSGHTTSAFCMFMILTLFAEKKSYGYVFVILATLVGISRIYLAQHFLDDVVAGSFLGVITAIFVFTLMGPRLKAPHWNQPLFKRS
ncbi:MAG: phosphatase PAP2 family protein [Bacteroidota bacterium]|nr:phosphatase PAP2 family protein [Bacteroidota bacterium]MDX5431207.1 phosphatase PAP2 family protein [Bacteroidota bacterium]MDX5469946.1 phosphatase PAP2 family protein [Bacteroidota bacterium]